MSDHPGTRACYVKGCRLVQCRAANADYAYHRAKLTVYGKATTDLVDAGPARRHLEHLQALGVGTRPVAARTGLARSAVSKIRAGTTQRIRPDTERRILAADDEPTPGQRVSAYETWRLIGLILDATGWSKARLSAELGTAGRALQLRPYVVTADNARKVRDLADFLLTDDELADPRQVAS